MQCFTREYPEESGIDRAFSHLWRLWFLCLTADRAPDFPTRPNREWAENWSQGGFHFEAASAFPSGMMPCSPFGSADGWGARRLLWLLGAIEGVLFVPRSRCRYMRNLFMSSILPMSSGRRLDMVILVNVRAFWAFFGGGMGTRRGYFDDVHARVHAGANPRDRSSLAHGSAARSARPSVQWLGLAWTRDGDLQVAPTALPGQGASALLTRGTRRDPPGDAAPWLDRETNGRAVRSPSEIGRASCRERV